MGRGRIASRRSTVKACTTHGWLLFLKISTLNAFAHVCVFARVRRWVWVGVGVLLGASVILTGFQAYFLTVLSGETRPDPMVAMSSITFPCQCFLSNKQCLALQASHALVVVVVVLPLHAALKQDSTVEEAPPEDEAAPDGAVVHVTVPSPADVELGGENPTDGKPILSFTPFTLAFRRIKYHVPKPAGKVSGHRCLFAPHPVRLTSQCVRTRGNGLLFYGLHLAGRRGNHPA